MSQIGKPNGDFAPQGPQGPQGPQIRVQILGQYVKDLSFENPGAPTMTMAGRPQIDLGVEVETQQVDPERFEVVVKLRVSAQNEGKPMFLLELAYAGLVLVQGAPPEFLQQVLNIDVAHLLFPFARRVVSDAIRDGGMPPLMIEPIDFGGLHRAKSTEGQFRTSPTAAV